MTAEPSWTIPIGAHDYRVFFCEEPNPDCEGVLACCDPGALEIRMRNGINPALIPQVVAHELLHAISASFDLGLTEVKVQVLSMVLCDVFRRAPWVHTMLGPDEPGPAKEVPS